MTLKTCRYELYSISLTGKLLDFTRFVISLNLNWGLNASKASAKVSFSPEAKKQLMNVKRGSQFVLYWGFDKTNFNKVTLYWTGTSWDVNAGVQIDLVHKSWELSRSPVRGVFTKTTSSEVATRAAKDKGIIIKVDKAKQAQPSTVAVNQTAEDEFVKQFKGQVIKHGFDGKTMEVVSFENLKDKAQVYYISTEYGFINNVTINYKARLPKDKSYIEIIGGGGSSTRAEPNANPSQTAPTVTKKEPPLPPGNYALLLSTGKKNELSNPILELKLVVDGQEIASYPCVSGKAFLRDATKTNNVIPDGEYTIDSKLVPGTLAEIGGKFLAITPKFKTSRSALGIHLDPSYNKKNNEDGTNGGIGLTTAADRNAVHKTILEKNIRLLVVNLSKSPSPPKTQNTAKNTAYYVGKLMDNSVVASDNGDKVFESIGSLFDLFIANAILKSNVLLDKVPAGQTRSIRDLLTRMLSLSEIQSANTLITELGGIDFVDQYCKSNGFASSSLNEDKGSSSAKDVFEALKELFLKNISQNLTVQKALKGDPLSQGLKLSRQTHSKTGLNSSFNGSACIVLGRSSIKYIVVIMATTEAEKLRIAKEIAPLLI